LLLLTSPMASLAAVAALTCNSSLSSPFDQSRKKSCPSCRPNRASFRGKSFADRDDKIPSVSPSRPHRP
jgi:hypothetical protein